jgi:hypothetical protein
VQPLPIDGYLGSLYILVTVNSSAIKWEWYGYTDLISFGYVPSGGIVRSYDSSNFTSLRKLHNTASIMTVLTYIPTNSVQENPLPAFVIICLLVIVILTGVNGHLMWFLFECPWWYLTVSFSHVYVGHLYVSFWDMSIQVICLFFLMVACGFIDYFIPPLLFDFLHVSIL